MMLLKALLSMAIGLAVLVSSAAVASPISGGDLVPAHVGLPSAFNMSGPDTATVLANDPSTEWHGYSTAQIWMGKEQKTVGNLVNFSLFSKLATNLDRLCPHSEDADGSRECRREYIPILASCYDKKAEKLIPCQLNVFAGGKWESNKIRNYLIIAAAGAFQSWTVDYQNPEWNPNCIHISRNEKFCNVGDVVRVNFPNDRGGPDIWNYLYVALTNDKSELATWRYDCCRGHGREALDKLMWNIDPSIGELFPWMDSKHYPHDSRCIIDGWKACR